ncbi:hypothetical protein PG985_007101 [Apiospora marii]|uniref:uncharacterized protein n=1 Tax=Apiospora marii TaxID=335849 RepID=UPI00312D1646
MAPSLINTVAVAAAFAAGASATKSYQIADKYNSGNFYDKWDFITTDPNNGYSMYQTKQGAQDANLVQINKDDFYLGADYETSMPGDWHNYRGRKSVRVESRESYNHGLFIGDFSHLPKPTCGTWPAFWMFGSRGEFDFLENWNDLTFNRITAHTGDPKDVGVCTIKQSDLSAQIVTTNCADKAPGQYDYQACSANSEDGVFGSATGGLSLTFDEDATEWTSEYIRQWSWKTAPDDVLAGKPDPSKWGKPMFQVSDCNIDRAFADLKFVLNINFCSVAAQDDKWNSTCQASTQHATCMEHVAANGGDFKDSFFKVKGISVYHLAEDVVQTTSASPSTSPVTSVASSATGTTSDLASTSPSVAVSASTSVSAVTASESSAAVSTASVTPAGNDQQSTSAATTHSLTTASAPYPYNPYKNGTISTSQLSLTPTVVPTSGPTASGDPSSGAASSESASSGSGSPGSGSSGSGSSGAGSSGAGSNQSTQVFTTKISTITSCAPSVTNCPARVTTETIALYTTVCPVSGATSVPKPTTSAPAFLTQTQYVTKVYTITSCAPSVTDCPARIGKVTTEVGTTTKLIPVVTPTNAYPVVGPSVAPNDKGGNTKTEAYSVVGPSGKADTPASTTVTQMVTNVYTITSCAPTVTDCPARIGSVTTEVRTKTNVYAVVQPSGNAGSNSKTDVYPVAGPSPSGNGGSDSAKTTTVLSTARNTVTNTMYLSLASPSAAASKPGSNVETAVYVTATVVPVSPSEAAVPGTNAAVKNNGTANGNVGAGCTGSGCKVTTSGGVRNGATSAALIFIGALVALY